MLLLRLLLAFVFMSLASGVGAIIVPPDCGVVKTIRANPDTYTSITAAIDGMARAHLAQSLVTDSEYVGGILRDSDGRFWATVGRGCRGQDTVTFSVAVPGGVRLAAFWHTHGAPGLFRDFFSPDDVELVRGTGYPFYLITPDGEMRVLHPDDVTSPSQFRHARRLGAPRGATAGRFVAILQDSDTSQDSPEQNSGAAEISAEGSV